jgi:aromatic ring-cleaving dioxygenase
MSARQFNIKAKPPEEAPVTAYHVHIYFDKSSEAAAIAMARKIDELFPGVVEDVHRVGKVGPHTQSNLGMTITAESFGDVLRWLQLNSQGLSILVHPRTGDEWKDHLECALWLGKPVELNMDFFEAFRPKAPKAPAP